MKTAAMKGLTCRVVDVELTVNQRPMALTEAVIINCVYHDINNN